MEFIILASVSALVLIAAFLKDRGKTAKGLKIGLKRLTRILFILFPVFFLLSVLLYFVPEQAIADSLSSRNLSLAWIFALLGGSVFMLPGFIAFPLGGALADNNVPYFVVSAFTSTLMLVGIITLPVEASFFGKRLAVLRNVSAFFIAAAVSLVTGLLFGEIL